MTENNKPFAMSLKKLHIIYFSPGGTTEKAVRTIASGMEGLEVETIDLLPSDNRKKRYVFGPDDLVVFGCMTAQKLVTLSDELVGCTLSLHDALPISQSHTEMGFTASRSTR